MATWPTITDDSGNNTSGTIINNTNVWTPIQSYIGGAWSTVTFAAGNFTASGAMTWTVASGDVTANRYVVIGKTLMWTVALTATTIGGTPSTSLYIAVPGGNTAVTAAHHVRLAYATNNGSLVNAYAAVADSNRIVIAREDSGNWSAGTDNNAFLFQIAFEIN